MRNVIVITGANTGVGFGIAQTLLHDYHSGRAATATDCIWRPDYSVDGPPAKLLRVRSLRAATTKTALGANRRPNITLVLACRNTGKAEQARQALVNEFYAGDEEEGLDAIQTQRLDLSDIKQVVRACDELKARFKRIHALVFNAGVLPVSSLSYWNGTKAFFTDPTNLAKTSADVIVQTVGMKTGDGLGLGEVFVANTLGHFGMLRELESVLEQTVVLERSEGREAFFAKVLWTSSTTAAPEFLDEADLQCLKGRHPYESSKRVMELLALAIAPSLRRKGILSVITSPGIVATGITQGHMSALLLVFLMHVMRFLGISGVNISARNAATSSRFLLTCPDRDSSQLSTEIMYHSDVDFLGSTWVNRLPLAPPTDDEQHLRVLAAVEALWKQAKLQTLTY